MHYREVDSDQERELVQRAKTEAGAFGEIFDTYYERILGYALKRTGDVDVAADIAAEVFAKALKGIGWFTWRGIPLSAWLYRIAGNEINMYFRRQKYVPKSLNQLEEAGYDPSDSVLVAERHEIEVLLQADDDEARIRTALSKLSRAHQEVVALRYFDNMRTKEIAKVVGKPEGTVRSLLSRAIVELRAIYEAGTQQKTSPRIIESGGRSGLLLQVTEL